MSTNNYAGPGAPVPCKPSHATAHVGVDVRLPDGRLAIDVAPDELRAILMKLDVPGVTHETGYARMIELYSEYVQGIYRRADSDGVAAALGPDCFQAIPSVCVPTRRR
jgi:hypothetical protein